MTAWHQLVYTSADLGDDSPGGWGVKLSSSPEATALADLGIKPVGILHNAHLATGKYSIVKP